MIEKINIFVSRILFGEHYWDGYIKEPERKEEYKLTALFPNDVAREKANSVLKGKI